MNSQVAASHCHSLMKLIWHLKGRERETILEGRKQGIPITGWKLDTDNTIRKMLTFDWFIFIIIEEEEEGRNEKNWRVINRYFCVLFLNRQERDLLLLHPPGLVAQEPDDPPLIGPNGARTVIFRPHFRRWRKGAQDDERTRLPDARRRHRVHLQRSHDRIAAAGPSLRDGQHAAHHRSRRRAAGRLPQSAARRPFQSGSFGFQSGIPADGQGPFRAHQPGAALPPGMPAVRRQFRIQQPSKPTAGNHPQPGSDSGAQFELRLRIYGSRRPARLDNIPLLPAGRSGRRRLLGADRRPGGGVSPVRSQRPAAHLPARFGSRQRIDSLQAVPVAGWRKLPVTQSAILDPPGIIGRHVPAPVEFRHPLRVHYGRPVQHWQQRDGDGSDFYAGRRWGPAGLGDDSRLLSTAGERQRKRERFIASQSSSLRPRR